jgi:hypothetical protein
MPITSLSTSPLAAAIAKLRGKTAVTSPLNSDEWADVAFGIRERAFFSATVESARFLSRAQTAVDNLLTGEGYHAEQRQALRDILAKEGYAAPEGKEGTLQDLASQRRLDLILKTNTEQAQGYAVWKADQDPDVLDAYPAQELFRLEAREVPRNWRERWESAGGQLYAGRMIARKDDPVWTAISRFGTPYPPFDFNSGMDVEDISHEEAVALGVIDADTVVQPGLQGFNARLEASLPDATPEVLAGLKGVFGDQVAVSNGKVKWLPDVMGDFYDDAVKMAAMPRGTPQEIEDRKEFGLKTVSLGTSTTHTCDTVQRDLGIDYKGWALE